MTDDPIVQAAAEALVNDIRAEHGLPPCDLSLLTEPDMIAYRVRAAVDVVAAVTPLIRAQIADEIKTRAEMRETVCATLAQIAARNSPGWDAGEMATAALRTIAANIAKGDQQ